MFPELSEAEAEGLVEESDRIIVGLSAWGADDVDLHLRHDLARTEVTDEELREYFEAHRIRFGTRSYEESRSAVEAIVRLRKLRDRELDAVEGGP